MLNVGDFQGAYSSGPDFSVPQDAPFLEAPSSLHARGSSRFAVDHVAPAG